MSADDSGSDKRVCSRGGSSSKTVLPYDPKSIENVILTISDAFDFRVIMNDERAQGALLVTTGLAIAGGLIGHHCSGKKGAVIGGVVGGACGLGIVAVSMRSIWEDIKNKLAELLDKVYDYLARKGLKDYQRAATFLTQPGDKTELAVIILKITSSILGKKILSTITEA